MSKHHFITFEGIDGCGKDTQLHCLVDKIKSDSCGPFGNKYSNIWITRQPTKITKHGRTISQLIRERDVTAEEASVHYVNDRKAHSNIIADVLEHSHVLCSRYDLSTLMFQMSQGLSFEHLYNMHGFEQGECLKPDLTIMFELPVKVAFGRISQRESAHECFEVIEFQEKVAENLRFCVEQLRQRDRNIIIVNADQPIDKVTEEMVEKIEESLGVQQT